MRILCVFGKHQYGDPSRGLSIEYTSFIPAFRRLGHSVTHFESWDKSAFRDYADLNSNLYAVIEKERPDVMFVVPMSYEIWIETLQAIKRLNNVATVCWVADDSWKYREYSRFVAGHYHLITTTYPRIFPLYARDGYNNAFLTQWAANAETMQEPLPASKCKHQITFVGAAHGDRKKRIHALGKTGLKIECFGHGWPNGSVPADEIPRIMRESIISLNFSNSKGLNQIKARTFEVPGAGGFLLTENAPDLENYYFPDNEIAVFDNLEELYSKARYYISNQNIRNKVAFAGYQRTCLHHTYDLRLLEILNAAKSILHKNKCDINSYDSKPGIEQAIKVHGDMSGISKVFFSSLKKSSCIIWGKNRGPRAARRLTFEISWRINGAKTYSSSSFPGRFFYHES